MERKKNKMPRTTQSFQPGKRYVAGKTPLDSRAAVQNEYRNLIQGPWVPAFLPLEDMPGAQPPDDKSET